MCCDSQEVRSGSELGQDISRVIDQGQIVQSETTVRLLQQAMEGSAGPFLIDGFPRSISNLEAFESVVCSPAFMLFLDVTGPRLPYTTRALRHHSGTCAHGYPIASPHVPASPRRGGDGGAAAKAWAVLGPLRR